MRHPRILAPENSFLLIVDFQDTLLRSIHGQEKLIGNVNLLRNAARILGVPVVYTLQDPLKLGLLTPTISDPISSAENIVIEKSDFSAWGSPLFRDTVESLRQRGHSNAVVTGVETHICVAQTAMDLSTNDITVHVAADACSSNTVENHKLGMERIRDTGCLPCAAESVVYEWLRTSQSHDFKAILQLVKLNRLSR